MLQIGNFMSQSKESLGDYISRILREKDLSMYQVEKRTRGAISQSYANRIKNGQIPTPSAAKLSALAKGLGVPESEIFAAAGSGMSKDVDIAHERLAHIDFAYEGMPKKKRQKADYIIELLEREIARLAEEPE